MLTLFYSPRACSMTAHVALRSSSRDSDPACRHLQGRTFDARISSLNPKLKVPTLQFADGGNWEALREIDRALPNQP